MTGRRRPRLRTILIAGLAAFGSGVLAAGVFPEGGPPRRPPPAAGSVSPISERRPGVGRAEIITIGVPSAANRRPSAVRSPVLPRSEPLSIDIPRIGVHSKLQYLGLTENGELEVPAPGPRYNDAAWYRYSPTPGSLGPASISGHVDSAEGGPSVFYRLGPLRPGDGILVTRADGVVAEFRVSGVQVFPKDAFPTALVYGNTDHAALRLITCGGPFNSASGHYLDNVVVFASLSGSRRAHVMPA